jgi:hypothetical protein
MSGAKHKPTPDEGERRDSETRRVASAQAPELSREDGPPTGVGREDVARYAQELREHLDDIRAQTSQLKTYLGSIDPHYHAQERCFTKAEQALVQVGGVIDEMQHSVVNDEIIKGGFEAAPEGPTACLYVVRRYYERWSPSAMAAALALPADFRSSADEWMRLIDELESAVSPLIRQRRAQ